MKRDGHKKIRNKVIYEIRKWLLICLHWESGCICSPGYIIGTEMVCTTTYNIY